MAKKEYSKLAEEIVKAVGGKNNIIDVTNCMTRLRFVLKDDQIPNSEEIKGIDGVRGVMNQGGQYQIINGTHVSEITPLVKKEISFDDTKINKDDYKLVKDTSLWNRFFKTISGCIMPMLGPMIAGGIIKGILVILVTVGVLAKTDGTYILM